MYGNIDSSDVLLNRGLNGFYGVGNQLGNFGGDGSAVKESVRGNRDIQLLEGVNRNAETASLANTVVRGNEFLTDRINQQFMSARFETLERLILTNQNDTQRDIANLNAKVTECCCKLEAGQAAIQAKLDAQALAALQNENSRLNMEISIRNNNLGN